MAIWGSLYSQSFIKQKNEQKWETQQRINVGSAWVLFIETSVQFSCSVVSDSLQSHGPQHTRCLCPSPTPGAYSNSYPSSQWCHPAISSSVIPFSSCLQSFPAWGSFSKWASVQFSSVVQLCPTLCDPMNRSMPGLPVHHHWDLPEGQTGTSGEKLRIFRDIWGLQKEKAVDQNRDAFWVKGSSEERPLWLGHPKNQSLTWVVARLTDHKPMRQFQSYENFSLFNISSLIEFQPWKDRSIF